MRKLIIFLDPAHGIDVAGKRSPDGLHREYKWSRDICDEMGVVLKALGFQVEYTNTSDVEIGLPKRRNFVENFKTDKTKVLISIHNNAAGDGSKWLNARGFEIWTKSGIDKADELADLMFKFVKKRIPLVRHRYATEALYGKDKEGKLYMTNSSKYFGVLLEWGFQDNLEDVEILKNTRMNKAFIDAIIDAVEEFDKKL